MAFQEIAIQFGVAAGRWLISKWLGGGAKPRPPEPGTIEVPTTQEGSALSLVYGTRRLAGNVVVVGRNSHAPLKPDGVTVTGVTTEVCVHTTTREAIVQPIRQPVIETTATEVR